MGQRSRASILLDKDTTLESLATNVADRTMMHADYGNSGKGAREKKESPRVSSCVHLRTGCRWERNPWISSCSKQRRTKLSDRDPVNITGNFCNGENAAYQYF